LELLLPAPRVTDLDAVLPVKLPHILSEKKARRVSSGLQGRIHIIGQALPGDLVKQKVIRELA
jgi:hypothetical protein